MDASLIWVPATLVASCGQVARNTMQRSLTEKIGTVGATQVRFLFGLPFALLFVAGIVLATGERLPRPAPGFAPFMLLGALTQIGATALMLAAMRVRSFAVVTALIKTEPVLLAVFGFAVLGDRLSAPAIGAIVVATVGVVLCTWTPRTATEARAADWRTLAFGLAAAGCFALSAIGFRGAILALEPGSFLIRATTALAGSLALQSAILMVFLVLFDRAALLGSFREWRSSLFAGFVGAAASQFWFIGFALTATANVRTLALVEVIIAQGVARRLFAEVPSGRELAGMGVILGGVAVLLWTH